MPTPPRCEQLVLPTEYGTPSRLLQWEDVEARLVEAAHYCPPADAYEAGVWAPTPAKVMARTVLPVDATRFLFEPQDRA